MAEAFKVDPAEIDKRIAANEAEALICEQTADRLDGYADQERREAYRIRGQNARILETARLHGYMEPMNSTNGAS